MRRVKAQQRQAARELTELHDGLSAIKAARDEALDQLKRTRQLQATKVSSPSLATYLHVCVCVYVLVGASVWLWLWLWLWFSACHFCILRETTHAHTHTTHHRNHLSYTQIRLKKDELREEVFMIQVQNAWGKANKILGNWEKEGMVAPLEKQEAVPKRTALSPSKPPPTD